MKAGDIPVSTAERIRSDSLLASVDQTVLPKAVNKQQEIEEGSGGPEF